MQVHLLSKQNSILNHFVNQLRDTEVQKDSMRFRKNMERIGEIMAYEISKSLSYKSVTINTPLGVKKSQKIEDKIVLCSILRAGLSLHTGFINFFDDVENGFISAFRHHKDESDSFSIEVEYQSIPSLNNKTFLLIDPMLATGQSLVAVLKKIFENHTPKKIILAVTIAAPEGISFLKENLPSNCDLWIADIDSHLNEKKYIIPGLGDAGDLAYGVKL